MSKNSTETKPLAKSDGVKSEADLIWDQIKKTPIALFGLSAKPLEEYSKRINVSDEKVHLSLSAPGAAIAAIEDALNVRRDGQGAEVRVNAFEVETMQNGMVSIGRRKA